MFLSNEVRPTLSFACENYVQKNDYVETKCINCKQNCNACGLQVRPVIKMTCLFLSLFYSFVVEVFVYANHLISSQYVVKRCAYKDLPTDAIGEGIKIGWPTFAFIVQRHCNIWP